MWHSLFYLSLFIKPVYADYDVNKTKQMLYLAQASYCQKLHPPIGIVHTVKIV